MDGQESAHHDYALPSAVHPKVVPRYVKKFRESSVKRDCAEAVRDRL